MGIEACFCNVECSRWRAQRWHTSAVARQRESMFKDGIYQKRNKKEKKKIEKKKKKKEEKKKKVKKLKKKEKEKMTPISGE